MSGVDHWSSTDVAQFVDWLTGGARGRGLATRAVTLMTGWLFELGAARVFLTIQSENAASAAVARRAGSASRDRFVPTAFGTDNVRTQTSSPCFRRTGRW